MAKAKTDIVTKPVRKPRAAKVVTTPEQLTENLTAAGRNVWLASLGAVATVGSESSSLFDTLVEKGRAREKQARPAVDRLVERTGELVDRTGNQLGKLGGRVEKLVKERTAAALHRIGVPSRDEIQLLIKRVEQLNAKVEYLASDRAHAVN